MKHNPSKAWILHLSHTESWFQLFQICWECAPKGTQNPSKLRPLSAFGAKSWYERGLKNTQKMTIRKAGKQVKKSSKKGTPNSGFCDLLGSGARGASGWSKRTPGAPCKVKSCWNLYTQSFAKLHIYYVLLGLVLDCTHTPPRKNKQKQKHTLSIRWVADSVGKEALRFQQALPRLGGKT